MNDELISNCECVTCEWVIVYLLIGLPINVIVSDKNENYNMCRTTVLFPHNNTL